jgi:cytochrome c553
MDKLLFTTHLGAISILVLNLVSCNAIMPKRSPGEKLYRKHCASCHGVNAEGHTAKYMGNENADLLDNSWEYGGDPSSISNSIQSDFIIDHHAIDKLNSKDVRQIVDHLLELRGERR